MNLWQIGEERAHNLTQLFLCYARVQCHVQTHVCTSTDILVYHNNKHVPNAHKFTPDIAYLYIYKWVQSLGGDYFLSTITQIVLIYEIHVHVLVIVASFVICILQILKIFYEIQIFDNICDMTKLVSFVVFACSASCIYRLLLHSYIRNYDID